MRYCAILTVLFFGLVAPASGELCDDDELQLVVKLRNPTSATTTLQVIQQAQVSAGRSPLAVLTYSRRLGVSADVFEYVGSRDQLDQLARDIRRDARVRYAVVDLENGKRDTNDPLVSSQWHIGATRTSATPYQANAALAWPVSRGLTSVIAILDTGILQDEEISSNVLPGYDFIEDPLSSHDGDGYDSNATDNGTYRDPILGCEGDLGADSDWHGLQVASVAAAVANNGIGIAGVAPQAKILPVRVSGALDTSQSELSDAILWAAGLTVPNTSANSYPADVISISLGGLGECSQHLMEAINAANMAGVQIVVSAGNSGKDISTPNSETNRWPRNCAGVIPVAASTASGSRAQFSNYGSPVQIAAPGSGITVLSNAGTRQSIPGASGRIFKSASGTSYSTPIVAATIAMIKSVVPSAGTNEIMQIIRGTADASALCNGCGAGIIDIWESLHSARLASSIFGPIELQTNYVWGVIGTDFRNEIIYGDVCDVRILFDAPEPIAYFKAIPGYPFYITHDFLNDGMGQSVGCGAISGLNDPKKCEIHGWVDALQPADSTQLDALEWPSEITFDAQTISGVKFRKTLPTSQQIGCPL